jgi:hypothetical protein
MQMIIQQLNQLGCWQYELAYEDATRIMALKTWFSRDIGPIQRHKTPSLVSGTLKRPNPLKGLKQQSFHSPNLIQDSSLFVWPKNLLADGRNKKNTFWVLGKHQTVMMWYMTLEKPHKLDVYHIATWLCCEWEILCILWRICAIIRVIGTERVNMNRE